jgi:hypothetical protein
VNYRWATVFGFAIIAAVAFFVWSGAGDSAAKEIQANFEANNSAAESAPQQAVVATWAVRDATIEQVRQNGVRNGLLGVCAALLASIAVNTALRERREAALARRLPVEATEGFSDPQSPEAPIPVE